MSDICKCKAEEQGFTCPIKSECYRFKSHHNPFYQSYFLEIPYDKENGKCDYFFPIKEKYYERQNSTAGN